jgi:hypothetical protein
VTLVEAETPLRSKAAGKIDFWQMSVTKLRVAIGEIVD